MAKLEAYLSIEKTVGSVLFKQWHQTGKAAVGKLLTALQQRKFNDAYDEVKALNLNNTVTSSKDKLTELGVSALLFGAQHVVPTKYTQIAKSKKIPEELSLALNQLTVMVEENGTDLITRRVTKIVQAEEEARQDELYATKKAEFNLADALNDAVLGSGKAVFDVGANLTTSRLVSYGFLDEAVFNQITTYQVTEVLDKVTCPVCRIMHGQTFQVASEHSRLLTVLRIQDPNELKSAAPWPSQTKAGVAALKSMSAEEMQSAGLGSPPYHPGCRGVLQIAGTVTQYSEPPTPSLLISDKTPDTGPTKVPSGNNPTENMLFGFGYDVSEFTDSQLTAIRALLDDGVPVAEAVKQVLAAK